MTGSHIAVLALFLLVALISGRAFAAGCATGYSMSTIPVCAPAQSSTCTPTAFDPTNPAGSGYALVFSDDFSKVGTSTIDMTNSNNTGYHWYLSKPFGFQTQPSTDITTDANGIILTATVNTAQMALSTATPKAGAPNGQGWIGTVFGQGGYFEINMSFDGPSVYNGGFNGWPAFWSMDVKHWVNQGGDQWPGQATGFTHFIEDDFFEYDNTGDHNKWGSAVVDWSGIYNTNCLPGYTSAGFCHIYNLAGQGGNNGYNNVFLGAHGGAAITWNVSTFHTLGSLWIPGNAGNNHTGTRTIYFDGQPANSTGAPGTPTVNWTDGTMPSPTNLPNSPEVWSIHDLNNIVVSLGGAINLPFHIHSVKIWQIPGCGKMSN